MAGTTLTVALIHEIFDDDPNGERLDHRLAGAAARGAELAVLPELPLDPWFPSGTEVSETDAEPPGGRRHRLLADAARQARIAVLGGAVVRHPDTGRRHNTALLFGGDGALVAATRKVHLPSEPGNWESHHYAAGEDPPEVARALPMPLGVQICSDVQRPTGCQLLAAAGAWVIAVPRATPAESWRRWLVVLRAAALTGATWIVTVNRPTAAHAAGGEAPSAIIAPDGEVALETTEELSIAVLDSGAVHRARSAYPGCLPFHPEASARFWAAVGRGRRNAEDVGDR